MTQKDEPTINEALEKGVTAIKGGDLETGKANLRWVLEREPNNVLAWLWMSRCAPTNEAKLECFNRVLAIDPSNKHALEGVRRYGGGGTSQELPAAPHESSSALPVQDLPKQRSRTALWLALGGALIAIVFCCGIIAVIGVSDPPATVADDSAAPIGAEVLVELPTEIPSSTEPPTPTNTPVPTRTPQPSATPDPLGNYRVEVLTLVFPPWLEGLEQISELSGKASVSPLLIVDDEWRLDMAVALATITIANEALRETDPTAAAQEIHNVLLKAAAELDLMVELMAQGIDEIDTDKISAASEAMTRASEHINRATELISALQ